MKTAPGLICCPAEDVGADQHTLFAISTSKARLLVTAITSGACPKCTHDLRLIVQTRPTQCPAEMKDVTEEVEMEKGGIWTLIRFE